MDKKLVTEKELKRLRAVDATAREVVIAAHRFGWGSSELIEKIVALQPILAGAARD